MTIDTKSTIQMELMQMKSAAIAYDKKKSYENRIQSDTSTEVMSVIYMTIE